MRYLIPLVVAFLCSSYTSGAVVDFNNLPHVVNSYNKNIEWMPAELQSLLNNEKVDVSILMNDGRNLKWGFETENAKIVNYVQGSMKDPTIDVHVTEDAINDVLNAADPMKSYQNAAMAGHIKIEGKTLGSILRLGTAFISGDNLKLFLDLIGIKG
jgi:hypothetical protein